MNTEQEVVEEIGGEITDETLMSAVSEVESDEVRATMMEDAAEAETVTMSGPKARAPKAPKVARAPKIVFSSKSEAILHKLGANPSDAFILETTDAALTADELSAKMDSTLAKIDTLAKKVQDKVVNVFAVVAGKARLSGYTKIVVDALIEKGSLSSKEASDALETRGYKNGTARAQSNQMFTVLPLLGIAIREGKSLKVNPESTLVEVLTKAAATGRVVGTPATAAV